MNPTPEANSVQARWGFIDRDGNVVVPFQFELAAPHYNGLATVKYNNKYGCIDRLGTWAIPPIFEHLGAYMHGLLPARRDGKDGYIDRDGRYVIQPAFDSAFHFQGE